MALSALRKRSLTFVDLPTEIHLVIVDYLSADDKNWGYSFHHRPFHLPTIYIAHTKRYVIALVPRLTLHELLEREERCSWACSHYLPLRPFNSFSDKVIHEHSGTMKTAVWDCIERGIGGSGIPDRERHCSPRVCIMIRGSKVLSFFGLDRNTFKAGALQWDGKRWRRDCWERHDGFRPRLEGATGKKTWERRDKCGWRNKIRAGKQTSVERKAWKIE